MDKSDWLLKLFQLMNILVENPLPEATKFFQLYVIPNLKMPFQTTTVLYILKGQHEINITFILIPNEYFVNQHSNFPRFT